MKSEWKKPALAGLLLLILCLLGAAVAQRGPNDDPTATLSFLIVKEDNGKPVRNAAVIMHPVNAPVSYTHLDVYKRQRMRHTALVGKAAPQGNLYQRQPGINEKSSNAKQSLATEVFPRRVPKVLPEGPRLSLIHI